VDDLIRLISTTARLDEPIDPDTPLISSGFIDSFDVVALLAVFESQYGVAIAPEQVDVETFDTPSQMLSHIEAART
jgi:acyl carrier protein